MSHLRRVACYVRPMAQIPDASDRLPDGIVVVVKEECATCHSVGSVLVQLDGAVELTVYTPGRPGLPE